MTTKPESPDDPTPAAEPVAVALTPESIAAEHPDIARALRAEGATQERERILGIEDGALPGHEDLVAKFKADGKTSPGDAALAIAAAEKETGPRKLAALAADDPDNPPAPEPTADPAPGGVSADAPVEERCKSNWETSAALRGQWTSFERYLAYTRATESGRVKELKRAS